METEVEAKISSITSVLNSRFTGHHHTEEARAKISAGLKGRYFTEEQRHKISETLMGHIVLKETKLKISKAVAGRSLSLEHRQKISEALTGISHPFTNEWRQHLSEAHRGKHHTEETKKLISKLTSGDRNGNWKGGIGYLPYPPSFNNSFKEAIKERDDYTCQKCSQVGNVGNNLLTVHHINYNKEDTTWLNCITLCNRCNPAVGVDRDYWQNYFQGVLLCRQEIE